MKIFCDGSPKRFGIHINETPLITYDPSKTSNVAEYRAVIKALHFVKDNLPDDNDVKILTDSELVVKQLRGIDHIDAEHLKHYHESAKKLINDIEELGVDINVDWVPREENKMGKIFDKMRKEEKRNR